MWLTNVNLVLSNKTVVGSICVENGRIKEIIEGLLIHNDPDVKDYTGKPMYLLPGLIDIHSDAIEKDLEPRPNTFLPLRPTFMELDKKLAGAGITTMYHSLSYGDGVGVRDVERSLLLMEELVMLTNEPSSIRHRLHLRYEVLYMEGLEKVKGMIRKGKIDYLSIMDHSPGQGQYATEEHYVEYASKVWGMEVGEIRPFLANLKELHHEINWEALHELILFAKDYGIQTCSHDDDSVGKIEFLSGLGIDVTEFPINLETAIRAREKGMHVCVGAPNIVRGGSHNKNMRAMDAILQDAATIIVSDYLPSMMLHAVFEVYQQGISLHEAVKMVTLSPAVAVGIENEVGSIEVGKRGDLVLVELVNEVPTVRGTYVDGTCVYYSEYSMTK